MSLNVLISEKSRRRPPLKVAEECVRLGRVARGEVPAWRRLWSIFLFLLLLRLLPLLFVPLDFALLVSLPPLLPSPPRPLPMIATEPVSSCVNESLPFENRLLVLGQITLEIVVVKQRGISVFPSPSVSRGKSPSSASSASALKAAVAAKARSQGAALGHDARVHVWLREFGKTEEPKHALGKICRRCCGESKDEERHD